MLVQKNFRIALLFLLMIFSTPLFSQAVLQPWGNLEGIRIEGQLMNFGSSLTLVSKGWSGMQATGKERQRPKYNRNGKQQIVQTALDSLILTQTVEDADKGEIKVSVLVNARANVSGEGLFLTLIPDDESDQNGTIQVDNAKPLKLNAAAVLMTAYLQNKVSSFLLTGKKRQLKVSFAAPVSLQFKNEKGLLLFIPVLEGDIKKGQSSIFECTIKASGAIDKAPVQFSLNTNITGRAFDGLGGNFRLQNAKTDPQVIDYCLKNLRVAWGRVEMPWRFWQPAVDTSPVMQAKAGNIHPLVQKSMEMAQRLNSLGMPVILTAWAPPAWAIVGKPKYRPGPDGVWGNPLDSSKTPEIYKSIADYIGYVKEKYGFEISMFSFNESDLGINIRQTGEEHAALIKGLGAYFVSRGFKTKLLLGDNSDATTYAFIGPALNDPQTHPYIGAVSFHSWRGWDKETLQKWADAATTLKLPLLVGEGSIDAAAWAYPAIFAEQVYSLEEINLYVRLLSICQPASILQWQLTADYSPLAGGGIFGDTTALRPLQRFWNLKQLSATPKGLYAMPLQSAAAAISFAALGDNAKKVYAFHFVNSGATRVATVMGIPAGVKKLRLFVTNKNKSMKEGIPVTVNNGKAIFILEETSFISLETM